VEAHVVQAVFARDAEHARPGFCVHCGISGHGEDATFQIAAQERGTPVEQQLCALAADFAQAERGSSCIVIRGIPGSGVERHAHFKKLRGELVPQRRIRAQRQRHLDFFRAAGSNRHLRGDLPLRNPRRHAAGDRRARRIVHGHVNAHGLAGDVRIRLHGRDPDRVRGAQFDPSYDAVPVRLRVLGNRMRSQPDLVLDPVIDAQRDTVRPGRE